MAEKLTCEACGETFGTMGEADQHEYNATMIDPEERDHWVQFKKLEETN